MKTHTHSKEKNGETRQKKRREKLEKISEIEFTILQFRLIKITFNYFRERDLTMGIAFARTKPDAEKCRE